MVKKPVVKKEVKKEKEKSLLTEAKNESAFLKAGILGFSGSGKTFTSCNIAIGLHKYANLKKPVGFFATEPGIDFIVTKFKEADVSLLAFKSKSFVDLMKVVSEAEQNCSILIIDSITHVWNELMESFRTKLNVKRLLFQHWNIIKPEWSRFSELYVSSNLHIIMCGRAGWEYEFTEDEDGVRELSKSGTKMKVESEFSYEPSLLMEMERVRVAEGKIGSSHIHRCWVLKDRADKINGKYFDDPGFDVFIPHIECLNLGGKHTSTVSNRSSQDLFEKKDSASNIYKRVQIALELIQNELVLRYPGRSGEDNIAKLKILKETFKTHSWEAIKILPVDVLEEGASKITKMPQIQGTGAPDKNAPADLCKEITNYAGVNDISVPKFLRKWSEGKIFKLTDLRTSELQQFFTDMKKSKK